MTNSPLAGAAVRPLAATCPKQITSNIIAAAHDLLGHLVAGRRIDSPAIRTAMHSAFGASDASGAWDWKAAYEAVEVAQLLFMRRYGPAIHAKTTDPFERLKLVERIARLAPTQTRRSEEMVAYQQFSTPLPLAFLVAKAAAVTPFDAVLEPSAGTGMLAAFAQAAKAQLILNERDPLRAQGLAGVRLQNLCPRARVLYVSATGATDPANLCYAIRLGLWGPGTSFADRDAFMAGIASGGIAAMEIVARDLKALGLYTARALSFSDVEYDPLEHKLTAEQIAVYNAYADGWAVIHANLDHVLAATNIVDPMDGASLNPQAKGSALSRFESAKQRFFGQVLVAMKMPTLIKAIEAELAAGHHVVVQLVTTAQAMLDRRLAHLGADERAHLDIELSPREYM